jgi:hypothetical protein
MRFFVKMISAFIINAASSAESITFVPSIT